MALKNQDFFEYYEKLVTAKMLLLETRFLMRPIQRHLKIKTWIFVKKFILNILYYKFIRKISFFSGNMFFHVY